MYKGGKKKLRHVDNNIGFEQFKNIAENVCSNMPVESTIHMKLMISDLLFELEDEGDYEAIFESYQGKQKLPLQVWIVKIPSNIGRIDEDLNIGKALSSSPEITTGLYVTTHENEENHLICMNIRSITS